MLSPIKFFIRTSKINWSDDAITEWTSSTNPKTLEDIKTYEEALDVFYYLIDREERLWKKAQFKQGRYILIELIVCNKIRAIWQYEGGK